MLVDRDPWAVDPNSGFFRALESFEMPAGIEQGRPAPGPLVYPQWGISGTSVHPVRHARQVSLPWTAAYSYERMNQRNAWLQSPGWRACRAGCCIGAGVEQWRLASVESLTGHELLARGELISKPTGRGSAGRLGPIRSQPRPHDCRPRSPLHSHVPPSPPR